MVAALFARRKALMVGLIAAGVACSSERAGTLTTNAIFARAGTAGEDEIDLCVNGAYRAIVANAASEGLYARAGDVIRATKQSAGEGPASFTLQLDPGDTASSPALGGGWTAQAATAASPDGPDATCLDLESRPWWQDTD